MTLPHLWRSLAQAAVSGCGDAYAAGVGVSIAAMDPVGAGGLSEVMTDTFAGVLSVTQSIKAAAAASQGIAVAFGSALPCESPAAAGSHSCTATCHCSCRIHACLEGLSMHGSCSMPVRTAADEFVVRAAPPCCDVCARSAWHFGRASAHSFNVLCTAEIYAPDFLAGVAWSIGEVAGPNGTDCPRASKVAVAFYNGLTIAAPDAAPAFAAAIGLYVSALRVPGLMWVHCCNVV